MTTKDLEFAKSCGIDETDLFGTGDIERFAELVRDQYRAELLAGSGEPAMRELNPHLNSGNDPYNGATHLQWFSPDQQAAAVLRARRGALEDAAVWCENEEGKRAMSGYMCAAAIRNMKDNT